MKKMYYSLLAKYSIMAFLILPKIAFSQKSESIDSVLFSKIKDEGLNNSKIMKTLSILTDVCGPRLTNSSGYKKAADYTKSTLESYGLQNVFFDYWGEEFGRGWQLNKFSLQSIEPVYSSIISYPKAWSPGIKGTVKAEAIYLDVKSKDDLDKYIGKLKGKIILFNAPVTVKPGFESDARRMEDSTLLRMSNAEKDAPNSGGRRMQRTKEEQQLDFQKWKFCQNEGVIAIIEASPGSSLDDGTIWVSEAAVPNSPDIPRDKRIRAFNTNAPKILPQVVVADEHYNRLIRQIQNGSKVKLELVLDANFTPAAEGFNVIGEIPGTDLKDEIVMIGAHLDSWHSATGATDNAAGSAVMMEVIRIIKTLGINPRRTIRIGLWDGEEQGLLGSKSYVKRNYGERLDKSLPYDSIILKPGSEKFSVYFNMDEGTGKYRGVFLQGNESARPIFRNWLKPFEKTGTSTLSLSNTGSTDHISFDAIGLPAFQFIQDPIEYIRRTHHTSMDLYDKVLEDDLIQNAIITAVFTWQAANREGLFPRK